MFSIAIYNTTVYKQNTDAKVTINYKPQQIIKRI